MDSDLKTCAEVEIERADRWSVYLRLQQLSIPCWCVIDQPLRVQVNTASAAVQLWSVVRQVKASRQECLHWLEHCWSL